ncbi:MAG: hypothetical protein Q7U04_15995 [Bacteriovorax sp.]|nr:hypothetical protein [Bacteriovorax sp.]
MKMQQMTKLTLAVLVAVQVLNIEMAQAKMPKSFVQTIKTKDKLALKDPYFQIKSVKVKELTDEEALEFNGTEQEMSSVNINQIITKGFVSPSIPPIPPIGTQPAPTPAPIPTPDIPTPGPSGAFDSVIMVLDKLIAIGQKIIPTIKEGKSVVNNNPMSCVSVLPRSEAKDPVVHDMGGWSIPVSKHYKISYKNGYGSEVVSFIYSISFQYNGSADGKGKYLAGIRASARNIVISWGFDLDASSQLLQISNVGTQQNVIAGATIEMSYTIKNWTKNISTSESFHVTGDGKIYKLD